MLIVEIVVAGLKGLPQALRVAPQAGVNVFPAVSPERRRRFLDAIFHTLHPDAATREMLAHLVDPSARDGSRLALAVRAKDGAIYRLVRDFGTGAARLQQKQGEGSDWSTLSSDLAEVAQFVRVQLRSPPFAAYERLYVLSPERLVARGEAAESRAGGSLWPAPSSSGPAPAAGGLGGNLGYGVLNNPVLRMPSALSAAPSMSSGAFALEPAQPFVTADLAPMNPLAAIPRAPTAVNPMNALFRSGADVAAQPALDGEALAREHARLQAHVSLLRNSRAYRRDLDAMMAERERLRANVAEVQAAFGELEQARAAAEEYKHLEGLPPGVADRIRDLEGADARRQKEVARLDEERDEIERARDRARGRPLLADPVFIVGAAAWLLAIVLGIALGSPFVGLLNVVGAALAAVAALANVSAMERLARLDVRRAAVEEKAARLDKQYELETGVAKKLLASLDADPMELLHQLETAAELSASRAAAEHRAALLDADPRRREELTRLAQLDARIDELESKLLSVEGEESSGNVAELERRLSALTKEMTDRGLIGKVVGTAVPSASEGRAPAPRALGPDDDERLVSGDLDDASVAGDPPYEGAPMIDAPGEARWASGLDGSQGGGGAGRYGGEGAPATDGTAALGAALSDVVHRPIEILGPALVPRLVQYLRAFTRGAYAGAEVQPDGSIRVRPADAEAFSPLSAVEPAQARAVEAAIHLAWLEAAVSRVAVPVLIDDPFVGVPDPVRKLIGKALGYVGERTQVIVLTPEDDLAGHVLGG